MLLKICYLRRYVLILFIKPYYKDNIVIVRQFYINFTIILKFFSKYIKMLMTIINFRFWSIHPLSFTDRHIVCSVTGYL